MALPLNNAKQFQLSFNSNLDCLCRGLFCSVYDLLGLSYKIENWYVSTETYVVPKNVPFTTRIPLILLISEFFCKNQQFLRQKSAIFEAKIITLLKPIV